MAGRAGISRLGDGQSTLDVRLGQQGDTMVSELHGRYYEQAARKQLYFSYSAARATTVTTTVAMVGNIVYNPPDSGVNLALNKWSSSILVTSATTTAVVLTVGYQSTTLTTLTAADQSGAAYVTQPTLTAGKARAFALATALIAPVPVYVMHHNTAAIAVTGVDQLSGDFEGSFVIPPGGFAAIQTIGATMAASAHYSTLMWEEVPTV